MKLLFRRLEAGEMERPPTQRDQFNNDDVGLSEALVREALQNSLDAAVGAGTVRVKFTFVTPDEGATAQLQHFLSKDDLLKHLAWCGMVPDRVDFQRPRLLLVEDFGTRGLEGSCTEWDEQPFCDFWRRMGLSHKRGGALGRWGLGKLVFSSASSIRCFFGLTVRNVDPGRSYLMGQAVLTTHRDGSTRYDSHGFFALPGDNNIQLPETSPTQIAAFRNATQLSRTTEPGLSVVIPFVQENITADEVCKAVLRNYFFPLLTGRLEVVVNGMTINAASFSDLATRYGDARFADGTLAEFICHMQLQMTSGIEPRRLHASWVQTGIEASLGDAVPAMREELAAGKPVAVRAPILLKRKDGTECSTYFDLYLQRSAQERSDTLFVRETIVLSAESKYFHGRKIYAALIAREASVCAFLGDAENPAHTSWSASAEKATQNWRNAGARLKEIRGALQQLHNVLVSAMDTVDPNALISVFSTDAEERGVKGTKPKGPITKKPRIPEPQPDATPKLFRVARMNGGFSIKNTASLSAEKLPMSIRVRAAYDVLRGNPFKKHDALDFDFTKKGVAISSSGALVSADQPNVLIVEVTEPEFEVQVSGFDVNRDLIVDPARSV